MNPIMTFSMADIDVRQVGAAWIRNTCGCWEVIALIQGQTITLERGEKGEMRKKLEELVDAMKYCVELSQVQL